MITDLAAWRAAQTPDRPALRWRGEWLSYAQLDRRATQLAARLHAEGVRRDDRVAILAHNHIAHVDLLLAARHRGCEAVIARGTIEALKASIESGQPILVMLDAGLEARSIVFGFRYPTPKVMHWAIVSGMASDDSQVLLAAEKRRHYIASTEDFKRRWEKSDFCMISIAARGDR